MGISVWGWNKGAELNGLPSQPGLLSSSSSAQLSRLEIRKVRKGPAAALRVAEVPTALPRKRKIP